MKKHFLLWYCTPRRLRTVARLRRAAKTVAIVVAIVVGILLAYGLVGTFDYEDAVASDVRAAKQLAQ